MKEISANKQDKSVIESSEILKKELFTSGLIDGSLEIDTDARSQLVEAIKSIPASKWQDREFYEIIEHLNPSQVKEEQVAENQ